MAQLFAIDGGARCATNQVWYSLSERGPAFALLPWQAERGVATMAYSPIDQGALASQPKLQSMASQLGATPAQVCLAWLAGQAGVLAIPKAASEAHLRENLAATELVLSEADRQAIDALFAPPVRKSPLAML